MPIERKVDGKKPYILLLTSRPKGWAVRRLCQAARNRHVTFRAGDSAEAFLEVGPGGLSMRLAGKAITPPAAVLPRLGPGNYENSLSMLDHFEAAGIPVANGRSGFELARDTFRCLLKLHHSGIRVPQTARLISLKDLETARKRIPGPPWILKTFTGAMGIGTMLVHKEDQLEAICATLWALKQPVLIQEFLKSVDASIADVRALVVGGTVLGTIKRRARPGEFRANIHRGGRPEAFEPSRADLKLALKAAKSVGLEIAGIDWIVTDAGPVVLEVNATPGFKGFEEATGIDAAGAMVQFTADSGGLSAN